jgi:hypothetical protein
MVLIELRDFWVVRGNQLCGFNYQRLWFDWMT